MNVVAKRGINSGISAEERKARVELAALYRILAYLKWDELIYTHTSLRVPGTENQFLINPYGLRFDEITASSLVKIDINGNVIDANGYEANFAGFVIHGAIHMNANGAHCVLHTHTTAGMAVAALEEGLLPASMYSHYFYNRIGYHEFEGPSMDTDERTRIVASIGNHKALIMRNHGLITLGETVAEAFVRMFRLERACQVQLAAQGQKLKYPSPEVCEQSALLTEKFLSHGGQDLGRLEFDAMVRLIEKIDPSYKN